MPARAVLSGRETISGAEAAALLRRSDHFLIGAGNKRALRLYPRLSDLTIDPAMDLVTVSRSAASTQTEMDTPPVPD